MKDEKYPTYEDERSEKRLKRRRIEKENYKEPQIEEKKRIQKDNILDDEEEEEDEYANYSKKENVEDKKKYIAILERHVGILSLKEKIW